MTKNEFLEMVMYHKEEIQQILLTAISYPVTMDELWKICRVAAMINTERGPNFTENLLMKTYKEYHGWTGGL